MVLHIPLHNADYTPATRRIIMAYLEQQHDDAKRFNTPAGWVNYFQALETYRFETMQEPVGGERWDKTITKT